MKYTIIQPPSLNFREMSKVELEDYFDWFMDAIPLRVDELSNAVRSTPGYKDWQAFNTPQSLDGLGKWLAANVETRSRTKEEIDEIIRGLSFESGVPKVDLTNRTFSLAMDTGMYVSQVFLQNYPSLRWAQVLKDKKSADYGQPVLIDFNSDAFNPVQIMVTLAYGLARKTKSGHRLREIYEYWGNVVSPS